MENKRDIFISYKNDGEGNNFAARLYADLEKLGYEVYYNPNEQHAGNFPDRLRSAVESCKDFLLVVTRTCLEQLMRHDKVDWVREELLTAHESGKNIIPLLMPGVSMPKDKDDMPEDLRFLPDKDAVNLSSTENYDKSPLGIMLNWFTSQPAKKEIYKDVFKSNKNFDIEEEFKEVLEKAENGDAQSMYEAGFYYYEGIAEKADYEKAAYWLFKASESDDEKISSYANSLISSMYYNGTIPKEEQSFEKSFFYLNKAVLDEQAKMNLAFMKKIGSGCEFNYKEIEKEYLKVKNADGVNRLSRALFYITYGEFEKAVDVLENMETLLPEAEYQLGLLYKLGVHIKPPKPDYITAAYHLQNAADIGHIQAAYELGMVNFNPTGRYKKNFKNAEKYFKIAADSGMSEAQYKLGWMYTYGLTGKEENEKALYYSGKAADQGHIGALSVLVALYQREGYTNYSKAFECAKAAADMGDAACAFRVANFYLIGRGCVADENKACEYYRFAYEHGVQRAKMMLDKFENRTRQ